MSFVRVRLKDGIRHEFDVPVKDFQSRPDRYDLIDGTPVPRSRPPKYIIGKAKKPRRKKPAETHQTDAPAGAKSPEEEAS